MVVREKNCYYAIALTDFFVFLSCAEKIIIKMSEINQHATYRYGLATYIDKLVMLWLFVFGNDGIWHG